MKKTITLSIALAASIVIFSCKSHQGCPGVGTSAKGNLAKKIGQVITKK